MATKKVLTSLRKKEHMEEWFDIISDMSLEEWKDFDDNADVISEFCEMESKNLYPEKTRANRRKATYHYKKRNEKRNNNLVDLVDIKEKEKTLALSKIDYDNVNRKRCRELMNAGRKTKRANKHYLNDYAYGRNEFNKMVNMWLETNE